MTGCDRAWRDRTSFLEVTQEEMRTVLENAVDNDREPMVWIAELHFAVAVKYSGMMLGYNA